MKVEPYLTFRGQAEEAIDFYRATIGARPEMLMRFGECPDPTPSEGMPAGFEKLVLHASFFVGESRIMCTDGGCANGGGTMQGFALSLEGRDADEAGRLFDALAKEGRIDVPMTRTFFSPAFGVVTDRFGVQWMVTVAEEVKQ